MPPTTEVTINVYDLLPVGSITTFLWHIGNGLLHSGVVINGKEYAYGGHDRKGVTGVYWTTPGLEPPGGTFRCSVIHGYTTRSEEEVDEIVTEASHKFLGPAWSLLTNNCNHFTSYLCERLTGRPAPRWLNRAASVGIAFPCMVPGAWISPPEGDNSDGELLDDDEDEDARSVDERTAILVDARREGRVAMPSGSRGTRWNDDHDDMTDDFDDRTDMDDFEEHGKGRAANGSRNNQIPTTKRSSKSKDAEGWPIPKSERAPVPD